MQKSIIQLYATVQKVTLQVIPEVFVKLVVSSKCDRVVSEGLSACALSIRANATLCLPQPPHDIYVVELRTLCPTLEESTSH